MANKTIKQLTTEITEVAPDDVYLLQRDTDSVTGKIKAKNAFGGGWTPIGGTLSVQSGYNKGNREFVIDTTEDLTSLISPGMRFKYAPTTTPPTQCADFESSNSQYATKSSPTGITFTDDWTAEAWIKLESYTGSLQHIVNKRNGNTDGWSMTINASGQLAAVSLRIASNNRTNTSYQAVPLGRWVHVAVTMDNSANSHTMYIDGVSVPFSTSTNGTITALVNPSQDLRVGALSSSSTEYFDGKIADVRVWSAVRTATQIRDNMWSTLTGSETNLVAYFPLNGDFNDSTANNNHLTAAGSPVATATNSDTPMPSTMFGIFTKVTSSELTVFTGSDYGIMNDGFSTSYFSYQKVPFGFPANGEKWVIETFSNDSTSTITQAWGNNGNISLSIPIGSWDVESAITIQGTRTTGSLARILAVLSESTSAISGGYERSVRQDGGNGQASNHTVESTLTPSISKTYSAQTTVYLDTYALATTAQLHTDISTYNWRHYITARCAYL